jgi:phenylacetate-CoA ligase
MPNKAYVLSSVYMSTFELILKINGFPIKKAKKKLVELNQFSFSQILKNQEEQKWNIFHEHFNHNPFYKELCNGKIPKDWHEVPVIQKKDLQKPIAQMINPIIHKKDLFLSKTAGSTGIPMVFAKDKFCHALTWAQILHKYSLHGIKGGDMQARFYGMPIEGVYYYKERIKDILSNRRRFAVNDLSEDILEKYIVTLKKYKFKYIYGYTNSIKIFAKYLLNKGLTLKDICPTVKCCIITSEMCTPSDEKLLKDAFLVPIINEYGASELGVIAFPDKEFQWRLSDEDLFVEVLNEKGQPVEKGAVGRLVVTSLYNRAMPIIRYELGDMASVNFSAEGNTLSCLKGRLTDTLRLPSGRIMPGATLYIAAKIIYDNLPELKEFIIKQTSLDTIEYDLVVDGPVDHKVKEDIVKLTFKYLEPGLQVKINKVDCIKRTASGKYKFFQSYIDSPEINRG